jgi:hypothetical protein
MTTRSRFALVLGVAGLVVAGVQLAMLSDPPTVVQLVVVAFWSVVGVAYLGSALAQYVRARRRPEPAPPMPAPLEEIVPVPVRPARPRPRPAPGPTTASDGAAEQPTRVAIRARRPAFPAPAARTAQDAITDAATTDAATTDALPVRADVAAPQQGPAPRPALRAVAGDAGPGSALSFGPHHARTVSGGPGRRPRPTPPFGQPRVRPTSAERPRPALRAVPDPLFDPLPDPLPESVPVPLPVPLPSAPVSGPVPLAGPTGAHAAPSGAVPVPRSARHRADVHDPVAARRGEPRHRRPTEGR